MKIDEACINHNVALIIKDLTTDLYTDEEEKTYYMILAEIIGANKLADRLKEVLKA